MVRCLMVGVFLLALLGGAQGQDKILQKAIDQSVVRGVSYLKSIQKQDGAWEHTEIGATALAGLTLLECGLRKDDPAVLKAARAVRKEAVNLNGTYSASLTIMFLDRLGDPLDIPIIEVLAGRLMSGLAGHVGVWNYGIENTGSELLFEYAQQREAGNARPRAKAKHAGELPKVIQEVIAQIPPPGKKYELVNHGDNSNTQFATLALWIARRYGFPIEKTLVFSDKGYRGSQYSDGGWDYTAFQPEPDDKSGVSRPAMKCTGLIGLAAYYGTRQDADKKPILQDPAVQRALRGLERHVGRPNGLKFRQALPTGGNSYYYLWTLERTAMLYGLNKIGDKDWYSWGAEVIVAHQLANGAWEGDYPEAGVDTCFALLFLKRSNIAPDLTTILVQGITKESASPSSQKGTPGTVNSATKDPAAKPDPSIAQARVEAVRLSTALLEAQPGELDAILEKFKSGKGAPYNQTLAAAIPQLKGAAQSKARKTLAERLVMSSAAEIRKEIKTLDTEIRRAAATAGGIAKAKELVPDLIDLLADSETGVAAAAHQSLREITSQDFGPPPGASREQRDNAIRAWREWWKKQ